MFYGVFELLMQRNGKKNNIKIEGKNDWNLFFPSTFLAKSF
jgi:hypothetical protein